MIATEPAAAVKTRTQPATLPLRRILIADDDESARRQLQILLSDDPTLIVDTVCDGEQALAAMQENAYSILITDLRMPRLDGMELIQAMQARQLSATVIVTTGHGSIDQAVQAVRLGAYHFLTKPINVERLGLLIQQALQDRQLQDEVAWLRAQLKQRYTFHNLISKNPRMEVIFGLIGDVASTPATVLICGETGTGKEQVAKAIHQASGRGGPLVAVNCAALPETLLESELFGHEKGAFTSAVGQRRGRFELAHGGTLFLDEVGDIPPPMQVKLLRVLQERRFERLGGSESIEVDVRIIAATNRSLQQLVKQGRFREDLYYRLNVIKIDLPPLRDRTEDIPVLARLFSERYCRPGTAPKQLDPNALQALLAYSWPGNIRELENAIERASVTSRDHRIRVENLPPELQAFPDASSPFAITLDLTLPEILRRAQAYIEHAYIQEAMKRVQGNVGNCAKVCGLSRRSMGTKVAEYGINKASFKIQLPARSWREA